MTTLAFLGTGTMGLAMCRNLLRDGFDVRVWNRTRSKAEPLAADGATVFDSAEDAARGCEILVTMLTDRAATEQVVLDGGALAATAPGACWIQHGTIGPQAVRELSEAASASGRQLLDTPVLGAGPAAQDGVLGVLVAGDTPSIDRCTPLFDAIGSYTIRTGDIGSASELKLIYNSYLLSQTAAVAESLLLTRACGIAPELFLEAIRGSTLNSAYGQTKAGLLTRGEFDDTDFEVDLAAKDAHLALGLAATTEVGLPVLRTVAAQLDAAREVGLGRKDVASAFWPLG